MQQEGYKKRQAIGMLYVIKLGLEIQTIQGVEMKFLTPGSVGIVLSEQN